MRTKYLVILGTIPLIIMAGFLLYSIPHGKEISSLENRFSELTTMLESSASDLKGDKGVESYCRALDNIPNHSSLLKGISSDYDRILKNSNFIRNIWRTFKFTTEDISGVEMRIDSLYSLVSPGMENSINRIAKIRTDSFNSAKNLTDVNKVLGEYSSDLKRMVMSFESFGQHISKNEVTSAFPSAKKVDFGIISEKKNLLQSVLEAGLKSIEDIAQSTNSSAMSSLESAKSTKQAIDIAKTHISWIESARKSVADFAILGAPGKRVVALEKILTQYINRTKSDIRLIDRIINSQKRSNEMMRNAVSYADQANSRLQNLERFASSSQIFSVYEQWRIAAQHAEKSRSALSISVANDHEKKIAANLLKPSRDAIERIINNINSHRDFVYSKYQEARHEESTFLGSTTRTAQRALGRITNLARGAVEKFSDSRIGKELSISVKALILGTKAFYDLMDPNTDPISWAFSYQSDVDQLMKETDEMMRMPGASITGKNTVIEDLINRSYESSYKKK